MNLLRRGAFNSQPGSSVFSRHSCYGCMFCQIDEIDVFVFACVSLTYSVSRRRNFPSLSLCAFQLEPLQCGGDRFSATGTLVILEPRVLNSNHCVLLFGMSYWLSPGFHWWEWNIVASTVSHTKTWIHLKTNNLCKVIQNICLDLIFSFVLGRWINST